MRITRPYPSYPTNFYSREEVDSKDQAVLTQVTVTSGDIVSQIPSLVGYATEAYVDDAVSTISGGGCNCDATEVTFTPGLVCDGSLNDSTTDAVSTQTGDSSSVIVSSEYNSTYAGWKVFDDQDSGYWCTLLNQADGSYIGWDFGVSTVINKFRYRCYTGEPTSYKPKFFIFQGSNDLSTWVNLHITYSGTVAPDLVDYWSPWFSFTSCSGYSAYRFYNVEGSSSSYVAITELEMVEAVTGGDIFPEGESTIDTIFYSIEEELSNKVSNSQLATTSGDIVDQIPSLTGYATESWVGTNYTTITQHTVTSGDIVEQIPSLTGYATETWVGDNYTTQTQHTVTSGDIIAQIPTLTGTGGIETSYADGVWAVDGSGISTSGTSSSGCGCDLIGTGGIEVSQEGDTWTIDGTNISGTTSSGCACTVSGINYITTYFSDSVWYVDGSSIPIPDTVVSGTGSINVTEESNDFWVVENLTTYTGTGGIVITVVDNVVTVDGSNITSSGTTSSGCGCDLVGTGGIDVSQDGDTWTIDGSGITSSGGGGVDTKLQNSLVMLTWKSEPEPDVFDDIFIDSYGTKQGINPSSFVGSYSETNEYIYKTTSGTYNSTLEFDSYNDFDAYDYKYTIVSWEQSTGQYGRFVDSDGNGVSVGAGNTASGIQPGMTVRFLDTDSKIVTISGTGENEGSIQISPAHTASEVINILGLNLDSTIPSVSVSSIVSDPSTLFETTSQVDYSSNMSGYHIRVLLLSTDFASDGTGQIRITVKGHSTYGFTADNISIVERDSAANGTEVPTEFFFSGSSGVGPVGNEGESSDWFDFAIDSSKDYLICIDIATQTVYRYHENITGHGYYYASSTDAYDQQNFSGSFNTGWHLYVAKIETRANVVPSGTFVGITSESTIIYTNPWESVNSIIPAEASTGSLENAYALKFNMSPPWKVFNGSSFREIVRKQGGVWQYRDNADTWADATDNNELLAIGQAMTYSGNQMLYTNMVTMDAADWSASGGFSNSSTYTVDLACGLLGDGSNTTTFYDYAINYTQDTNDITVETNTWEASSIDPEVAYCVIDMESYATYTLDTDVKAFVTTDSGSNYSQITGLSEFRSKDGHDYIRGDISSLPARTDQTMALKITTHNAKDIKIHGVALGIP